MTPARVAAVLALFAPFLMSQEPSLSIDDVVRVKHVSSPVWSPDGKFVAFAWDDQGVTDAWVVSAATGRLTRVTETRFPPSALSWSADGAAVAYIEQRRLWYVRPGETERGELTGEKRRLGTVTWSPKKNAWAFEQQGLVYYQAEGSRERDLGNAVATGTTVLFSPDGTMVIANVVDKQGPAWVVTDVITDQVILRSKMRMQMLGWMPDGKRLFARRGKSFIVVDLKGVATKLWEETAGGHKPLLSPTGDKCLLTRVDAQGWAHLWVVTLADGSAVELTSGAHEVSEPAWSPDGESVVYVSNAQASGERHLYLIPASGGDATLLTSALPGTNMTPLWSPDGTQLAFLHCGPQRALDIWLMRVAAPAKLRQLTFSMPAAFTADNAVVPEEVTYKGALEWDIHGWLFKPENFDPTKRYPAIVWVHGGPIRQMRYGWHPRRGYSILHSYHQRLLELGYVVLSVNYRGGIGYGREFRQGLQLKMGVDDVVDVIKGGQYLQAQPFVDADRVGVWGISYGGFLTMQALGKHPGTFCMGINVAGVFNWATQVEIYSDNGRFLRLMGGKPEKNPEPYRVGSPVTYVQNIDVPLLNLHGRADRNVPFSQMDELVQSMVEHGLDFEVMYYPGQPHVFRDGDVWRHAFMKIERFFEQHLKGRGAGG